MLSALLARFALPHIGQDTIAEEDRRFRAFLESKGWDTRTMGVVGWKVGREREGVGEGEGEGVGKAVGVEEGKGEGEGVKV